MKKQIRYKDSAVFYQVVGNGRPVMLLHGFGEKAAIWKKQVAHLQDSCQLIIPDLPGSGDSAMIDDMSIDGMADCIHAIILAEKMSSISIIGHSMGGYITLALVEKYPQLLRSFGLFHSTAFADSEEKKQVRQKGIAFIKEHGAFEFLKTTIPNLFSQQTKDEHPELIANHIATLCDFSAAALIAYYHAMINRPDRTHVLKSTDVPVLFILGKYDNAVPLNDSLKQCHQPSITDIHILSRSGHMGMYEQAEQVNTILKDFLQ